jgi:hypothetical protein
MSGWGDSGFGGGAGFRLAPLLASIDPSDGEIESDTVITLDVVDEGELSTIGLIASYPDGTQEVIYNGTAFARPAFKSSGTINSIEEVSPGLTRFRIRRVPEWEQSPSITLGIFDDEGNLIEVPE